MLEGRYYNMYIYLLRIKLISKEIIFFFQCKSTFKLQNIRRAQSIQSICHIFYSDRKILFIETEVPKVH